jgi:exosortase
VILFFFGWQQVVHWWLPLTLTLLSVPLPDIVMNRVSLPLQFIASKWGTAFIQWRNLPVETHGNVITITSPDTGERIQLFVAEACSGLRSLNALLALGIAAGGLYLTNVWSRGILLLLAVPVAIVLNSIRVFLTAFLMYYVSPAFGNGFMHESEGWGLFVVACLILGTIAAGVRLIERVIRERRDAIVD